MKQVTLFFIFLEPRRPYVPRSKLNKWHWIREKVTRISLLPIFCYIPSCPPIHQNWSSRLTTVFIILVSPVISSLSSPYLRPGSRWPTGTTPFFLKYFLRTAGRVRFQFPPTPPVLKSSLCPKPYFPELLMSPAFPLSPCSLPWWVNYLMSCYSQGLQI